MLGGCHSAATTMLVDLTNSETVAVHRVRLTREVDEQILMAKVDYVSPLRV